MANEIRIKTEIEIDPDLIEFVQSTSMRHYDRFTKQLIKRGSSCYAIKERIDGGRRIVKHWITEETYREKFGDLSSGTEAMV